MGTSTKSYAKLDKSPSVKFKTGQFTAVFIVMAAAMGGGLLTWRLLGYVVDISVDERIRSTILILGSAGGIVALVTAYRKQAGAERQAEIHEIVRMREDEDRYRGRYLEGVGLLASSSATERIAGVYILIALTDMLEGKDSQGIGRMVHDVLCGYLRTSRYRDLGDGASSKERIADEIPVENIIIGAIRKRKRPTMGGNSGDESRRAPSTPGVWSSFEMNLSGAVLQARLNLKDTVLENNVILNDVELLGGISLEGAVLRRNFTMNGAVVRNISRFQDCYFGRSANFKDSTFESEALFARVVAESKMDLLNAHFMGTAQFTGANLKRGVNFAKVTFDKKLDVQNLWSGGLVSIAEATVKGAVRFRGSVIDSLKIAHCSFNAAVTLESAMVLRDASMKSVDFRNPVSVRQSKFLSGITLNRAKFKHSLKVDASEFDDDVVIKKVGFREASVEKSAFSGNVLVKYSESINPVRFSRNVVKQALDCSIVQVKVFGWA